MTIVMPVRYSRSPLLLACFFLWATSVHATHNRAGEITYEQIGTLTIRATITTYTQTSSVSADRDTLQIFWGDSTSSWLYRANGTGDELPNDIKRNFYVGEHIYPGAATYTLSTTDPNRIAGIENIDFPNSVNVRFHIATTFTLLSSQFQGQNSSAVLLQPPIDIACLGQRYIHNPNAYDPDGDSLAYSLIVPLQDNGSEVPNYRFPDEIASGPENTLWLDPLTGDLIWDAPQMPGDYNLAILIREYRQGVLINTIIRDMQVEVRSCDNRPPTLEVASELCVVAGELIQLPVIATDPDAPDQLVSVTAIGGPLALEQGAATFSPDGTIWSHPAKGTFTWQTRCEHISPQTYTVVFRAVDNFFGDSGLSDLKTTRIKVVGPPPENLTVTNQEGSNKLHWNKPYACDQAADEFFRGFTIWRKSTSQPFVIDTCRPGLEGYTPIAFGERTMESGRYVFCDEGIELGASYCYRITAAFGRLSAAGYPYNLTESLASNEDCAGFASDRPLMTKVSVSQTSRTDGAMAVSWTRPRSIELASLEGPFTFQLYRGTGFDPGQVAPVTGAVFTAPSVASLDTHYVDQGLNTVNAPYTYHIVLERNGASISQSQEASSVFLEVSGADRRNILTFRAKTPWTNYRYEIYRRVAGSNEFTRLASTTSSPYVDHDVINGTEYCYYVASEGSYGFSIVADSLINLSQMACATPADVDPPCPPELTVTNSCSAGPGAVPTLLNSLQWSLSAATCSAPEDVAAYHVYYEPQPGTGFTQIAEALDPSTPAFQHGSDQGISGCYYVTALDSLANESDSSNVICVEHCPIYQLPNTFTPNDDGHNDIFRPYPYQSIERVEMVIFNRWGQVVFRTTDPDINWTGQNLASHDLSQGVYHYTCKLFESKIQGTVENPNVLRGFIELIR